MSIIMCCFLFIGSFVFTAPAMANAYDDQLAIERAARQIHEYDQKMRRDAEKRQYAASTTASKTDPLVTTVVVLLIVGVIFNMIASARQSQRVMLASVNLLKDAFQKLGVPNENIYFEHSGRRALGIDAIQNRCILLEHVQPADTVNEKAFYPADILGCNVAEPATIEINIKNVAEPLIALQMLEPKKAYAATEKALVAQQIKKLHATLMAFSHA